MDRTALGAGAELVGGTIRAFERHLPVEGDHRFISAAETEVGAFGSADEHVVPGCQHGHAGAGEHHAAEEDELVGPVHRSLLLHARPQAFADLSESQAAFGEHRPQFHDVVFLREDVVIVGPFIAHGLLLDGMQERIAADGGVEKLRRQRPGGLIRAG